MTRSSQLQQSNAPFQGQSSNTSALQRGRNAPLAGAVTSSSCATPSASHTCYDIPILDDEVTEFVYWKFRVQVVLEAQDLWTVVDGTFAKPNASTDPTGFADWSCKDRAARIQISLSLHNEPLKAVCRAKTAKECWDKLTSYFKSKGGRFGRVLPLMEELFQTTLSESEPIEPQIDRRVHIASTLDFLGFPVGDKLLAFAIVISIPESMATLKTILYTTNDSDISTDLVRSQLVFDEHCRVRASGDTAAAYFAKAAKKKREGKKCAHCNKRGHDVRECRKLKKEKEESKGATDAY